MDGNTSAGSTPKMDWSSGDLPSACKAFKQHCEFTFDGPLKQKSEEVKCNYLMLWIGEKGREIYTTWELQIYTTNTPTSENNHASQSTPQLRIKTS